MLTATYRREFSKAFPRRQRRWTLFVCADSKHRSAMGLWRAHDPVNYSDELVACKAFIKREIEDIRTDGRRPW